MPLGADGPDLDQIRELVADDPSVKGIWVVPTYANPTGAVYTEDVTRALVAMPAAAPDFRIFWDNAYARAPPDRRRRPRRSTCSGWRPRRGNPNRVFLFASTSKITFAGAGVSFFAGSPANVAWYLKHLGKRTIGPDKVNHLRHARYLGSADGVRELMRQHRAIIEPKFEQVDARSSTDAARRARRGDLDPAAGRLLHQPRRRRTAPRTGWSQLAKEAGIAMTGAGRRVPVRQGPAGPQHPDRADLPVAGRRGDGHRGPGHLRAAGRHRAAARRELPAGAALSPSAGRLGSTRAGSRLHSCTWCRSP